MLPYNKYLLSNWYDDFNTGIVGKKHIFNKVCG